MRILLFALLAACAGDSPPATGRCSKQIYDPCNTEDNCITALCQNFAVEGFQVCSQPCGPDLPECPTGGTCNEFSVCKPAEPNDCEL